MAAPQRPTKRMESRCIAATARATLAFVITRYSLHKGMGVGKFIHSTPVSVGGYEWCIRYYPDGAKEEVKDCVSVFVELQSKGSKARALYDLRLVDQDSGLSSSMHSCLESPKEFITIDKESSWGLFSFKKRSELEQSAYLRDDRLVIECDLTVIMEPIVTETTAITQELQTPPSDLSDNFRKLLETGEEADVTFDVQGELFPAHKLVLAARSPVFKAELYGPMRDKHGQSITVHDMQPAVFKELLQFIYTDSLPSMDNLDGKEMVKHLLVAADRYSMERMKTECEGILCKSLEVGTVATMLALADQHHCSKLKEACVEFIMTTKRMDDMLASKGYVYLKKSCPAVLVDIFEWVTKSLKIRYAHPR